MAFIELTCAASMKEALDLVATGKFRVVLLDLTLPGTSGIETFLAPGAEVLVAGSAAELVSHLRATSPESAYSIGAAARRRVLREHTYSTRASQLEASLSGALVAEVTG